ncbi:NADP-dependent dehydrogenase-like protein [Thozetella sp. PMI_491]|nr:NADP-dependent dehydrogenase-like protein [Thozetella sp. PMI_491]
MSAFIVTGARTGIGREYVKQLASEPSNTVIAIVRDLKGDLSALKSIGSDSPGTVHILECDVSSSESLSTLGPSLKSILGEDIRVKIVINNAAALHSREQDGLTVSGEALLSHITTNVVGPATVLQTVLPYLAPGGIVANITSGLGSLKLLVDERIPPSNTPYSISKTALNMLTVHQAYCLKGKAIVVCIDPGHVKTEMGGPNAVVEIPDSAGGVLSTLNSLKAEDSGKFLLYTGAELPW